MINKEIAGSEKKISPEAQRIDKTEVIKQFTREESPEERRRLATEIRARRTEYFTEKAVLRAEREELAKRIEERSIVAEEASTEINVLEARQEELSAGRLSKIINFFSLRSLRREIGEAALTKETLEEELNNLSASENLIRERLVDRTAIGEIRGQIAAFYAEQKKVWEDREIRDTKNVVAEHDVLFIHALNPSFTPKENSPIDRNRAIDWREKLKIFMAFDPTVSASSVREGATDRSFWAPVGVILSGGRILDAFPGDAGTVARRPGERIAYGSRSPEKMKEMIAEAVSLKEGYNEFVIAEPETSGLFVLSEESMEVNRPVPEWLARQVGETANEIGCPLYVIHLGRAHKGIYNPETGRIERGEEISTQAVAEAKYAVPEETKSRLTKELMEDSPFKAEMIDAELILSRTNGRNFYLELNAERLIEEGRIIPQTSEEAGFRRDEEGTARQMEKLFEFYGKGFRYEWVRAANRILKREINVSTGEVNETDPYERWTRRDCVWINYSNISTDKEIASSTDYLDEMEKSVAQYIAEREAAPEKGRVDKSYYTDWLKNEAFHLCGFGDQAQSFGDEDVAGRARAIAAQIISYEEVSAIIEKRLGPKGEFRITEEDLGLEKKKMTDK